VTERRAPVAVVMVGGRGERLRPLTDTVPKPLLEVGGRPIVVWILRQLASAGLTEAWLTVNYMAQAFVDAIGDGAELGLHVNYLHEREPLGTAGALGLLPADVSGPVLVTNGDVVTDVDLAALLDEHAALGAALTVCAVEHRSQVPYGVLRAEGGVLLGIEEKPVRRDLVSAGIYVVGATAREQLTSGEAIGMPELIDRTLHAGLAVRVHRLQGAWHDIGSRAELERVTHLFAERDGTEPATEAMA